MPWNCRVSYLIEISFFFHFSLDLSKDILRFPFPWMTINPMMKCGCTVWKLQHGILYRKLPIIIVNKPLSTAGILEGNAQGWKIVQEMNSLPRSEASRGQTCKLVLVIGQLSLWVINSDRSLHWPSYLRLSFVDHCFVHLFSNCQISPQPLPSLIGSGPWKVSATCRAGSRL